MHNSKQLEVCNSELKMKIIVILLIVILLISSISIVTSKEKEEKEKKVEKTIIKNLKKYNITPDNTTKLLEVYGEKFPQVIDFNSYSEFNNITIINVSTKKGYARIITSTITFRNIVR